MAPHHLQSYQDISAPSEAILCQLNEHADNLVSSDIVPKAANGTEMHPIGKLPVIFKLGNKEFVDEPDVCGVLISWKACKNLGILPDCYPQPVFTSAAISIQTPDLPASIATTTPLLTEDFVITEFIGVFDGTI